MRTFLAALLAAALVPSAGAGEPSAEYRAWWVETFHTPFATRPDVDRIVRTAIESNVNALFMQVRRRGDSWYLEGREPLPEIERFGEPDETGLPTFDPLAYLIEQAHARGIEVHAFAIIGAVARDDPRVKLPADPKHVFLRHIWDPKAKAPYRGRRQWATRALPPNQQGTSYDGYRFGDDWYIDLGHPDAASYTIEVLTHLVEQYDLDGIHLDRIRYPEAPQDRGGVNVGYNETSIARFNERYGRSGTPAPGDPLWNDWRREQVTSFVRRLYLNVKAIRPSIKVSAAVICYGDGPAANGGFQNTEPYARVFQDWKSWVEEGLLDVITPMAYKRETLPKQKKQFDDWSAFTAKLAREHGRISVIGIGTFMNSVPAMLRQARRARAAQAHGMIFFSLASTNAAVQHLGPGAVLSSSRLSDEDFYSALLTGWSADGRIRFEQSGLPPLFGERTPAPRIRAATGHLMGTIPGTDGLVVTIENAATGTRRTARTDGSGFFGSVHLEPGTYRVVAENGMRSCPVRIVAGQVARVAFDEFCGPRQRVGPQP
ncbi:MAG TPA: family 10 glycosylhydrolase [Thermoanaerobaculia bacterium]|nr:family 10 glycosylhydrolase [Thermoanaerobaculia bacterium]